MIVGSGGEVATRVEGYPRYPYEERGTELPIEWSGAIRLWITGVGR